VANYGVKNKNTSSASRGRGQRKKDRKIALLSLYQGRRPTEKRPKIAKKDRKIALLSLYLLYIPCM